MSEMDGLALREEPAIEKTDALPLTIALHARNVRTFTFDTFFQKPKEDATKPKKEWNIVRAPQKTPAKPKPTPKPKAKAKEPGILMLDDPIVDLWSPIAMVPATIDERRIDRIRTQEIPFVDHLCFRVNDERFQRTLLRRVEIQDRGHQPSIDGDPTEFSTWIDHLGELPLLTSEQEVHLFRQLNYLRYRASGFQAQLLANDHIDPVPVIRAEQCLAASARVSDTIARCNLRLVRHLAYKYARGDEGEVGNIFAAGSLALTRAINAFDFGRGFRFSTIAFRSIEHEIWRYLNESQSREFTGSEEEFFEEKASTLNPDDDQDAGMVHGEYQELIQQFLKDLDPRERFIVEERFGLHGREPLTLEEVGEILKVTRERIRQLEARAMRKLATFAREHGIQFEGFAVNIADLERKEKVEKIVETLKYETPELGSAWANLYAETELLFGLGLSPPAEFAREDILQIWRSDAQRSAFLREHPEWEQHFEEYYGKLRIFSERLAEHLGRIVEHPDAYGVPINWRETQREALSTFAQALRSGIYHIVYEIPTGVGKSMVIGAFLRAYFEVCIEQDLLDEVEAIIFTSRSNLVEQLMRPPQTELQQKGSKTKRRLHKLTKDEFFETFTEGFEDGSWYDLLDTVELIDVRLEDESDEGLGLADDVSTDAINLGDVRKWLAPVLRPRQMRMIAGYTGEEERRKDACLTIQTYQGLSTIPQEQIRTGRRVRLVFFDEAHRLSAGVRKKIPLLFPAALRIGGSATMEGPPQSQPFSVFQSRPVQDPSDFTGRLTYHASFAKCADRNEVALVRRACKPIAIDLSDIPGPTGYAMNEDMLSKRLLLNVPLLLEFIDEVYREEMPLLALTHSPQPKDRLFIASVRLVALARELAERCRTELGIPAEWTSGQEAHGAFREKVQRLRSRETRMLFSAGKLGEGLDAPEVDGILSLWPYTRPSAWVLKQLLGRGTRVIPGKKDCLIVEPHFEASTYDLASVPQLFHVEHEHQGGIVVPGMRRDVECRIIELLNAGLPYEGIQNRLRDNERQVAEGLGWDFSSNPASPVMIPSTPRKHLALQSTMDSREPLIDVKTLHTIRRPVLDAMGYRVIRKRGMTMKIAREMSPEHFQELIFPPLGDGLLLFNTIFQTQKEHLVEGDVVTLVEYLYLNGRTTTSDDAST